MGFGDWVICTGQVKKLHAETGKKVHVVGFNNRPQWSVVFEGNPKIVPLPDDSVALKNAGGCRPYIRAKTIARWYFQEWDSAPGEVFLSDEEKEFAQPYRGKVLIEPHTKVAGGNKSWPWARWQAVVDRTDRDYVQVGPVNTRTLDGVHAVTTTFRQAMAVLAVCKAYVGPEGALHHAAAALDVPAIVLWAEFIDMRFTGYASQRNIRHAGEYCGSRLPCQGCRRSMEAITVEEVLENVEALLG